MKEQRKRHRNLQGNGISPASATGRQQQPSYFPKQVPSKRRIAPQFHMPTPLLSAALLSFVLIVGLSILFMSNGRLRISVKLKDWVEVQTEVNKLPPPRIDK